VCSARRRPKSVAVATVEAFDASGGLGATLRAALSVGSVRNAG